MKILAKKIFIRLIKNRKGEIMISKISFTGREEMLVNPLKKATQKAETYVRTSSILPELPKIKLPQFPITKVEYTSPFAPIPEGVGEKLLKTV